jgi:hypothetical protein
MLIDVRVTDRLKGPKAIDAGPVLATLLATLRDSPADPSRLRVVCDWMQYRQNFREPIQVRQVLPSAIEAARASQNGASDASAYELAIDLRRTGATDLAAAFGDVWAQVGGAGDTARCYLEDWGPGSSSCIWEFNTLYWKALGLWEQATGRGYEQALPGGQSDARNVAAARELIQKLFKVWDDLAERRALPEELHVLEIGVGNGNQARVWLDEFQRLDRELGRNYYRKLQYLMGDYSPHVLELARANVRHHADRISALVLDATRPTDTLGFLRSKAFLVYISNVYDNLPTDEVAWMNGQLFRVLVRAYLPGPAAARIAAEHKLTIEELPAMAARLRRLGPELLSDAMPERFPEPLAAVTFWRDIWEALELEERYVPLEEVDAHQLAPEIGGEILLGVLGGHGDLRVHVSNGALASFADTLPLLHPLGMLECHDLFVTDLRQYATGFRGPGKYDGSVVNWINGPLLAAVGRRHGYDVSFAQFAHRSGSNVVTLTTSLLD